MCTYMIAKVVVESTTDSATTKVTFAKIGSGVTQDPMQARKFVDFKDALEFVTKLREVGTIGWNPVPVFPQR